MYRKIFFCVILVFSFKAIALTNEEKARKLYVEANLELEKNCSNYFTIFDTILDLARGSNLYNLKNDYNLSKINELIEYQNKIEDSFNCYNFMKNNFLPVVDEIQTKYSSTQVAYDLVRDSLEYGFLKLSIDEVLEALKKEKRKIKIKIEANKAEIEKENNRIINCYTNLGIKYERKKIKGCDEGDTNYNPVGLLSNELTVLVSQLQKCFDVSAGTVISEGMYVKVSAQYNKEAQVNENSVRVVDTNISKDNIYYDAIINSAMRTFYNPECVTLKVPLDKYDSWKNITINFDFEFMKK